MCTRRNFIRYFIYVPLIFYYTLYIVSYSVTFAPRGNTIRIYNIMRRPSIIHCVASCVLCLYVYRRTRWGWREVGLTTIDSFVYRVSRTKSYIGFRRNISEIIIIISNGNKSRTRFQNILRCSAAAIAIVTTRKSKHIVIICL